MESLNHTEAAFQAADEMGFRAVIGNAMMDRWEEGTEMKGESTDIALKKSMTLFEQYHGTANGRLHFAFCPRGTRNVTDELWQEIREITRDNKIIIHSHAAENKLQTERLSEFGGSEVVYLNKMGVLGPNLILAHAIWLTDEEHELLSSTGTHVAHCPSANFKLASGIAPVPGMLEKGINIAVGADGAPCNNNLDTFQEMRLAALIHKPRFGPKSMPARDVLKMMTIGGAKAAGLDHQIGSIEIGKKADLVLINQKVPHACPSLSSDPISRIVYEHQSRDVDTVIIDGKVVMHEGHFMDFDEMEILLRSEIAQMELLNRLSDPVKSAIVG
jgi:cytosine/adenosine deaminase-related metal-dependent hydrolase